MLALLFADKNPALAQAMVINSEQAKFLSGAICDVAQHYNMTPNPVVVTWVNLFAAAVAVYMPQYVLYNELKNGG